MASELKMVFKTLILSVALFGVTLTSLQAQMFSVGEPESPAGVAISNYTTLSAGFEPAEFTYSSDALVLNTTDFGFENTILRILFESPAIDLYLGVGGKISGMDNQNYFNLGAVVSNTFTLNQSDRFWIILPVQINTDLTRSSRDGASQEFQQSAFQFGAGPGIRARVTDNFSIMTKVVPSYGFSVSQGSIFGGSIFSVLGKGRLYFENIFGGHGLVFGYDYTLKKYDIDGDTYDYDFSGHTFSLGFSF